MENLLNINFSLIITFIHGACFLILINGKDYKLLLFRSSILFNLSVLLVNVLNVISLYLWDNFKGSIQINLNFSIILNIMSGVCALLLYLYFVNRFNDKFDKKMIILTVLMVLISLLIYQNNILFSLNFDSANKRMELYYLYLICIAIFGFKILYTIIKNRKSLIYNEFRVLMIMMLFYFLTVVYQLKHSYTNFWTIFTIYICIYIIYIVRHRNSYDYLTGALKINAVNDYYNHNNQNECLLVCCVVEEYSRIKNDYGVSVADKVIQLVAINLKDFFPNTNSLVRISTDELALICYQKDKSFINELKNNILNSIEAINNQQVFPFDIKVDIKSSKLSEFMTS